MVPANACKNSPALPDKPEAGKRSALRTNCGNTRLRANLTCVISCRFGITRFGTDGAQHGTCLAGALAAAGNSAALSANVASAFDFGSAGPENSFRQPDGIEQLLRALDRERRRLGQELHDSAGQLIACLQLSLARLEIEDPEHGCLIHEIQDITRKICDEIRSVAFLQYPAELADHGLASAVENFRAVSLLARASRPRLP